MTLPNTFTASTAAAASEVNANFDVCHAPTEASSPAFGGDGSDGALTISSGTTSLTRGRVYEYSSISITGTAKIAATGGNVEDPIIVKCSGNCTINVAGTAIDLKGAGLTGGAAANAGTSFSGFLRGGSAGATNNSGAGGAGAGGHGADGGGTGGKLSVGANLLRIAIPGAGGGGGDSGGSGGAAGGDGGGAIFLEIAGNLTITSGTIDVRGDDGLGPGQENGGGGGGGGSAVIICAGTISDSGTWSISGGAGGIGDQATPTTGGDGGTGKYVIISEGVRS